MLPVGLDSILWQTENEHWSPSSYENCGLIDGLFPPYDIKTFVGL